MGFGEKVKKIHLYDGTYKAIICHELLVSFARCGVSVCNVCSPGKIVPQSGDSHMQELPKEIVFVKALCIFHGMLVVMEGALNPPDMPGRCPACKQRSDFNLRDGWLWCPCEQFAILKSDHDEGVKNAKGQLDTSVHPVDSSAEGSA